MTTCNYPAVRSGLAMFFLIPAVLVSSANAIWLENGNPVCAHTGDQWYPKVIGGPAGDVIAVWEDHRDGSGNIFVQKLAANGQEMWSGGGIMACADMSGREFFRQAVSGGDGGAVIAWTDHRDGEIDIYAQKIGGDGACAWGSSAVAISGDGNNYYPCILPDGSGGAFLAWQQGDYPGRVFVQRVDNSGAVAWSSGGVAVCDPAGQAFPSMVSDGGNGVIVAWISGDIENSVILAQRLDSGGARLWSSSARVVCSDCTVNTFMDICADGSGGAVMAWQDMRAGGHDIFAQRIDPSGAPLWDASGVPVCVAGNDQWLPQIASCEDGEVVLAWVDERGGGHDIYAQSLDASGNAMWADGGLCVCGADASQLNPRIVTDGESNTVIAWQDGRNGDYDIYAQKLDRAGAFLWIDGGRAIAVAEGDQRLPELAPDGAGGTYVSWESFNDDSDICCQRIDAQGQHVATILAAWSASAQRGVIEIRWRMSEIARETEFSVSRRDRDGAFFTELQGAVSVGSGPEYFYGDSEADPGTEYIYRVDVKGIEGARTLFETGPIGCQPVATCLGLNRPNPFNPVTSIAYNIGQSSRVSLAVYDVSGKKVAVLAEGVEEPGEHIAVWDGTDDQGRRVSSGVYFARLEVGKKVFNRKMILMK